MIGENKLTNYSLNNMLPSVFVADRKERKPVAERRYRFFGTSFFAANEILDSLVYLKH